MRVTLGLARTSLGEHRALPFIMRSLFRGRGSNDEARRRMQEDPDIKSEELLPSGHPPVSELADKMERGATCPMAKLSIIRQSHTATAHSARIVEDIGGLPVLRSFTTRFYQKAFQDPHLDQFIRSHDDPHGERFATWIAEKLGAGKPWSDERRGRVIGQFQAKGYEFDTPHDRSSSHYTAWHSPKRPDDEWGEHFKLDTCRVWMRLHFWAMREEGLHEHAPFMDYYVRFIAHFVSVYERTAPPFARESMRWSADPANLQRYVTQGRKSLPMSAHPHGHKLSRDQAQSSHAHTSLLSSSVLCFYARRAHARDHGDEPPGSARHAAR